MKMGFVLRKKVCDTDEGPTTDRLSLLFGHSVPPRTGTSLVSEKPPIIIDDADQITARNAIQDVTELSSKEPH
jgi:hypothetical protein